MHDLFFLSATYAKSLTKDLWFSFQSQDFGSIGGWINQFLGTKLSRYRLKKCLRTVRSTISYTLP